MSLKLGIIMDPIESIKPHKDTNLALLLEAQRRGWTLFYMEMTDLSLNNGQVFAATRQLTVQDDPKNWFHYQAKVLMPLNTLDLVLMRKDPPVDRTYIHTTYLLDLLQKEGTPVFNHPQSLRDVNEKLFTAHFKEYCPATVVTYHAEQVHEFIAHHKKVILKPTNGMGGTSVFMVEENGPNLNVIIETLTDHGKQPVIAQAFIEDIRHGDKRIIMVNGEPYPYALARIAAPGEVRANLAAGGHGIGLELSARDREICKKVGPILREKNLLLVGLDVIGDYLTEINVTSPTCIRELEAIYGANICALVLDCMSQQLESRKSP